MIVIARKKKAKIDADGYVHFLNDKDGMSSKDYLLVLSTGVFFLFICIGLTMSLLGINVSETFLSLLETTVPIVMTVVGGTMGVQAVESFASTKKEKKITDDEGDDI